MKEKEILVEEAEFTEIDSQDTSEVSQDTEDVTEASEFVPMQVNVLFHNGQTIPFTITDIAKGDIDGWKRWIKEVMNDKTEDGFFVGSVFIQDSKVKYFEMV